MNDWKRYLDVDFGSVEGDAFHIDGYVYLSDDGTDTSYRAVQFAGCYVPLDKRADEEFVSNEEEQCKQYIGDITEEQAKERIEWYLENCEVL